MNTIRAIYTYKQFQIRYVIQLQVAYHKMFCEKTSYWGLGILAVNYSHAGSQPNEIYVKLT
jgi:hypothetical protein